MEGWVSIHRQIMDHWIYKDAEYLKTWLEMLLRARFSKEPGNEMIDGEMVTVSHGQFIFGRVKWSERLGIGEQRLRTLLKKLQGEGMIELVSTHRKCTIYRICNYENFQNIVFKEESSSKSLTKSDVSFFNHEANHQIYQAHQEVAASFNHDTNQQLTISQPSPNHQLTTKEQSNKDNKEIINNTPTTTQGPNPFRIFESEGFGTISSVIADKLGDFIDTYGERWTCEAMREAVYHGKRNLPYVKMILERYKNSGVDEPWTVPREQQQNNNVTPFKGKYQKTHSGKPSIPVVLPTASQANRISDEELAAAREMARKLDEKFKNPTGA